MGKQSWVLGSLSEQPLGPGAGVGLLVGGLVPDSFLGVLGVSKSLCQWVVAGTRSRVPGWGVQGVSELLLACWWVWLVPGRGFGGWGQGPRGCRANAGLLVDGARSQVLWLQGPACLGVGMSASWWVGLGPRISWGCYSHSGRWNWFWDWSWITGGQSRVPVSLAVGSWVSPSHCLTLVCGARSWAL